MKKLIISLLIGLSICFTGCTSASAGATTKQVSTNNVQYYFTRAKQNPDIQLIKVIDSAKTNLDIAIYSLTKQSIVDSIIQTKNRGVNVRIITDKIESKSKSEKKMLILLKNDNIPIKINSHQGLMHMKVSIADKSTVTTGSYNYTQNATKFNDEVLVIIKDSNVAQDFEDEFSSMWSNNNDYKNYN